MIPIVVNKGTPSTVTPFRWNTSKHEQMGRFLDGPEAEAYPDFIRDLRRCCARVLSTAGDSHLVFVGRSPESLFEYLGGGLRATPWSPRLSVLNLSLFGWSLREIRRLYPGAIEAVRAQLQETGLSPSSVASRSHQVAFVDLVNRGGTFGQLTELLLDWTREIGYDERAVVRRLRFVAITSAVDPSPNAERWNQRCAWVSRFRPSAIASVSIPAGLWDYLGNWQAKVARSHPPECWGDAGAGAPPRDEAHLKALRLAVKLRQLAEGRDERLAFASELANQPAMRFGWFRSLVTELRVPSANRRPTRARAYARTSVQASGRRGGRI
jgi:hypothetical protein